MNRERSLFSIINEYRRQIPVNLYGLLKELNIQLLYSPLKDNLSGIIQKIDDNYRIIVNETHSETRKRFTIAHELGHFIYHRDLIGDGIADNIAYRCEFPNEYNNPNIGSREETEANKFAVNLLMPHEIVESYRKKITGISDNELVEKMANEFNVSKQAMAIKLRVQYP